MRFIIENINKVKKADIRIDGLTVIAGENDTGKSTVGKMLFSIFRAISDLNSSVERSQDKTLSNYINSIYKRTASIRHFTVEESLFPLTASRFKDALKNAVEAGELNKFLNERIQSIKLNDKLPPRVRALVLQDFDNIKILLENSNNNAAELATKIQYLIESEFINKVCSNGTASSSVEFYSELTNKNKASLAFKIEKECVKIVQTNLNRESGVNLRDATYVESPLYIHMLEAIVRSSYFRETSNDRLFLNTMVPIHIKDFAEKIDSLRYYVGTSSEANVYLDGPLKGHFEFDKKNRTLHYISQGVSYSPLNVASGIKAFGVLHMLLEAKAISPDKILIWDEPENHLHPSWQIEFARVIVQLSSSGIPIIISTHSPYFIQAIRYYSAYYLIENYVKFYLSEEAEGYSVFEDVTNDLNRIFIKLASPLNEVMNLETARKNGSK